MEQFGYQIARFVKEYCLTHNCHIIICMSAEIASVVVVQCITLSIGLRLALITDLTKETLTKWRAS